MIKVYSKMLEKEFEVETKIVDEKTGQPVLSHCSFFDLYNRLQCELGLSILPIGTPKDWICMSQVVVPVLLKDKDGREVCAIGEAGADTLKSQIQLQYPVNIAFNRGFDKSLSVYLDLDLKDATDLFLDNEYSYQVPVNPTDESITAEMTMQTVEPEESLTEMESVSIPAPQPPVMSPVTPVIEEPIQASEQFIAQPDFTSFEMPIPEMPVSAPMAMTEAPVTNAASFEMPSPVQMPTTPVMTVIPESDIPDYSTQFINPPVDDASFVQTEMPTMPSMPEFTQQVAAPIMDMSVPVNETPVQYSIDGFSDVAADQQPVQNVMDETQPLVGNPASTVITFGPAAYEQGHNTIGTASREHLNWLIQNITPTSMFYPIRQDAEAFLQTQTV